MPRHPCCTSSARGRAHRVWSADGVDLAVDESTFRAEPPLPGCPDCGAVARPNVLMFGDWHWVSRRTSAQEDRFRRWLDDVGDALTVVELGAGTAVPTVRLTSEHLARRPGSRLVRINPRDTGVPPGAISLPTGALWAIEAIEAATAARGGARAMGRGGRSPEPAGGGRSAVVAVGILLSRLAGFARQRAVAHYFGTGPYADVLSFALRAPNLLQNLLGEGTLSASFIPIYSRMLEEGREKEAGRFAGAIFGLLLALAGGLALLGVLLAEPFVAVLAAGFLSDARARSTASRWRSTRCASLSR